MNIQLLNVYKNFYHLNFKYATARTEHLSLSLISSVTRLNTRLVRSGKPHSFTMSASDTAAAASNNEDDVDDDDLPPFMAITSNAVPPSLQPFYYKDQHDSSKYARSTAKMFTLTAKSMPNLFAMAIGTVESFPNLMKRPPFSKVKLQKHKKDFILTKDHLVAEIARRSYFIEQGEWKKYVDRGDAHPFGARKIKPRPGAWNMDERLVWLEKFKIRTNQQDLSFLKKKIGDYTNNLNEVVMAQAADKSSNESYWERSGWPNLGMRCRFIQVITSDEMRPFFVARDAAEAHRTELDARGTESAPKSAWQRMADEFNDETKTYQSLSLGENWGHWYSESHELSWSVLEKYDCVKLIDGKEMKKKFQEMNNFLGSMYKGFMTSGNGDDMCGKQMESGDMPVDVAMLPTQGGDRYDFLNSRHPSILYLWYQLLAVGLWATACTEFPVEESAQDGSCPSVGDDSSLGGSNYNGSGDRNAISKRVLEAQESQIDESKKSRASFGAHIHLSTQIASLDSKLTSARTALHDSNKQYYDMEFKRVTATDPLTQAAIASIVSRLQADIDKSKREIAYIEEQIEDLSAQSSKVQRQSAAGVADYSGIMDDSTPIQSNTRRSTVGTSTTSSNVHERTNRQLFNRRRRGHPKKDDSDNSDAESSSGDSSMNSETAIAY